MQVVAEGTMLRMEDEWAAAEARAASRLKEG
mgnify:CR=1 FL=1